MVDSLHRITWPAGNIVLHAKDSEQACKVVLEYLIKTGRIKAEKVSHEEQQKTGEKPLAMG